MQKQFEIGTIYKPNTDDVWGQILNKQYMYLLNTNDHLVYVGFLFEKKLQDCCFLFLYEGEIIKIPTLLFTISHFTSVEV